ncbi:hypothetical protein ACMYYO_06525 [Dermacoccaceae bacterium W4C1]
MSGYRGSPEEDRARFEEIVAQLREDDWPLEQADAASPTQGGPRAEDRERDEPQDPSTESGTENDPDRPGSSGLGKGLNSLQGHGSPHDWVHQPEPTDPAETEPAAPPAALNLPAQWRSTDRDSPGLLDALDAESESAYVPPEPEPLPAGDLTFWGALAGLIGGPLWLLYLFFFDREARGIWWVLACATAAAGVILMVVRQPESRDDSWDDDVDGAVL